MVKKKQPESETKLIIPEEVAFPFGGVDLLKDLNLEPIKHQEIYYKPVKMVFTRHDKTDDNIRFPKYTQTQNKKKIAILGSAATPDPAMRKVLGVIDEANLRVMSDAYTAETRKDFATHAYANPTLTTSLQARNESLFENGYTLELQLSSMMDEKGNIMPPEVAQSKLDTVKGKYEKYLAAIRKWDESEPIETLNKMKSCHINGLVQGRAVVLIMPPLSQLGKDKLPDGLKFLNYELVGNPLVDIKTWSLVAVRMLQQERDVAMPDEMIYLTMKNWGLRLWSDFYGTSMMESLIIISRVYMRLIHHDLLKLAVAAYLGKMHIKLETRGTQKEQQDQINAFIAALIAKAYDFVVTNLMSDVKSLAIDVKPDVIKMVIDVCENIMISGVGVTKTMMGREENLNRDIATIQSILFTKYRQHPDEMLIAKAFENQLYNPLLAHLAGEDVKQMPVKIVVKRIEMPVQTTVPLDEAQAKDEEQTLVQDETQKQQANKENNQNKLAQQKNTEVSSGQVAQQNPQGPFGSSGEDLKSRIEKATK